MALLLDSRAAIAAALSAAAPATISGETLARGLGISRVAVGKHVTALRALGFAIESTPRVGYRLLDAPDVCIPETVAPLLRDPLWVGCEGGSSLGSTNDEAKRRARAGAPEGTAVVAARQTGGRGRFGRAWESPPGGVYVSCVLRPGLPPASLGGLSLALAVGVADALEVSGVPVAIKWPNDLLAGGRKLGGILVEMAAEADRTDWLVVGCGVNVARPADPLHGWVREHAPAAGVAEVGAAVLDALAAAHRGFLTDGLAPTLTAFTARDALRGTAVVVRDAAGTLVADGIGEGVSADGSLLVRGAGGVTRVVAGEVTLRGASGR